LRRQRLGTRAGQADLHGFENDLIPAKPTRFESGRQILGRLEHAVVAQIEIMVGVEVEPVVSGPRSPRLIHRKAIDLAATGVELVHAEWYTAIERLGRGKRGIGLDAFVGFGTAVQGILTVLQHEFQGALNFEHRELFEFELPSRWGC